MKHYFRAVEVFIHLPKSIESILIFPISVLFLELYGMSAGCGCGEKLIRFTRVLGLGCYGIGYYDTTISLNLFYLSPSQP